MARDKLIALRRDSAADWLSVDPVLSEGEPGYETDTGRVKIGDGSTAWSNLEYTDDTIQGVEITSATPSNRDVFRYDSVLDKFVLKSTNEYNNQQDGFTVSKDNDDVERRMFVDDFSVDSSENYTGDVASFTWDTANGKLTHTTSVSAHTLVPTNRTCTKISLSLQIDDFPTSSSEGIRLRVATGIDSGIYLLFYGNGTDTTYTKAYRTGMSQSASNANSWTVGTPFVVTIDIETNSINVNGTVFTYDFGQTTLIPAIYTLTTAPTFHIYEISYLPSESYSDDFTSDTVSGANGRYVSTVGSVSYSSGMLLTRDIHNVTYLKSYKFSGGSFHATVELPTSDGGDESVYLIINSPSRGVGASTNHIRVGLRGTTGEWSPAYGSALTGWSVDATIASGDTVNIEIECDATRGVCYAYVYKTTKPTTPTFKIYTATYLEGEIGFRTYGGDFTVKSISIRAESIVGRTNVEEEEAFWFRDEFSENSLGRYPKTQISTLTSTISGGEWHVSDCFDTTWTLIPTTLKRGATNVKLNLKYIATSGSENANFLRFSILGINFTLKNNYSEDLIEVGGSKVVYPNVFGNYDEIEFDISDGGLAKVFVSGSEVLSVDISASWNDNAFTMKCARQAGVKPSFDMKYIQISGTRVYNKPIHRGAMLETYHDGTQEVAATTFVDDCNWDRSGEYTMASGTTLTYIPASGYYTLNGNTGSFKTATLKQGIVGEGWYRFGLAAKSGGWGIVNLLGGYRIAVRVGSIIYFATASGDVNYITGSASTTSPDTFFVVDLLYVGTTVTLYLDGTLVGTTTNEIFSNLSGAVEIRGYNESNTVAAMFNFIQIIAAADDATNGIAASISGVGGGARYDTVEEVYYEFNNSVKQGEYRLCYAGQTTDADSDAVEGYFENTTDSSYITEDSSDTLATALTTTRASFKKTLVLDEDDREDTIKVAIRRTSEGTANQAVSYIEYLAIAPVMEVE